MSSDFGDIFQYERDLFYDALQCSTPVRTPILDDRRIFHAACNDSICLAKGDKGPHVEPVDAHLVSTQTTDSRTTWKHIGPTQPENRILRTTSTPPSPEGVTAIRSPLPFFAALRFSTSRLRDAIFQRSKLYKDPSTADYFRNAFRIKFERFAFKL